jgi:hypothetical protein
MHPLRESLSRLLKAHEPNPALIVDGLWNLIEANRAASFLWDVGSPPERVFHMVESTRRLGTPREAAGGPPRSVLT